MHAVQAMTSMGSLAAQNMWTGCTRATGLDAFLTGRIPLTKQSALIVPHAFLGVAQGP